MPPFRPIERQIHDPSLQGTRFDLSLGEIPGADPYFTEGAAMETDPVCKMPTDPDMAEFKSEYKGKEYYFCSSACYDKFTRNPKDYI